jgi:hypothetical protein
MTLVSHEQVGETIVCGDDPEEHLDRVRRYLDAGVDEVYVQQVGADHEGFFRGWAEKILPQLR